MERCDDSGDDSDRSSGGMGGPTPANEIGRGDFVGLEEQCSDDTNWRPHERISVREAKNTAHCLPVRKGGRVAAVHVGSGPCGIDREREGG